MEKAASLHPNEGTSLSWLAAEEKLLTLELAMLEEHGLTLPPETQPLKGFARRGQTSWRRTELDDTRKALERRKLMRWTRRGSHPWAVVEEGANGMSKSEGSRQPRICQREQPSFKSDRETETSLHHGVDSVSRSGTHEYPRDPT